MSFNLSDLKNELDTAVNDSTSFVDAADKLATIVAKYSNFVPGVGPEVGAAVGALSALDSVLHAVKGALNA